MCVCVCVRGFILLSGSEGGDEHTHLCSTLTLLHLVNREEPFRSPPPNLAAATQPRPQPGNKDVMQGTSERAESEGRRADRSRTYHLSFSSEWLKGQKNTSETRLSSLN